MNHAIRKSTTENPFSRLTPSNDQRYVTPVVIVRWLLILFAYGWWLAIILPFTLFDVDLSVIQRLQSLPLVLVALTLVILFQTALNRLRYALAALFACGLFIAGAWV